MSRIRVDDSSSSISYSGGWGTTSGESRQYQGGTHYTTSVGATASISFRGTSIRVVGTNPLTSVGGNNHIEAQFILDGQTFTWSRTSHGTAYYQDLFWESGYLDNRQHTFTVRNAAPNVAFHLDCFEVDGTVTSQQAGPQPPPPSTPTTTRNNPPPTTREDPATTSTRVIVATSTEVLTSTQEDHLASQSSGSETATDSASLDPSSGRSNPTSLGAEGPSGSVTVTAVRVVTTSVGGSSGDGTIGSDGSPKGLGATSSRDLPVGAIVGIIIGAIVFLLLLGILFVLAYRRRRRRVVPESDDSSTSPVTPYETTDGPTYLTAKTSLTRGPTNGGRPFHRLSDEETESQTSPSITTDTPPAVALNFTPDEKSQAFFGSSPFHNSSDASEHPSPLVSENPTRFSAFSFRTSDAPPPAYSTGRNSTLYASAQTSLTRH